MYKPSNYLTFNRNVGSTFFLPPYVKWLQLPLFYKIRTIPKNRCRGFSNKGCSRKVVALTAWRLTPFYSTVFSLQTDILRQTKTYVIYLQFPQTFRRILRRPNITSTNSGWITGSFPRICTHGPLYLSREVISSFTLEYCAFRVLIHVQYSICGHEQNRRFRKLRPSGSWY